MLLFFFSHFLHQFHEMLIRCIHIFSFVHKILFTAPTIPVLTNNWFIHLPNKEKKLPSLFVKVFRDLRTVHFKLEVTTGHYVRARASLADKRISIFPGLSRLLANATKDDIMSYLACLKTISGLLYDLNRSIRSISFPNHRRSKTIPTFSKLSKIHHVKQKGSRITIISNLHSRVTLK